MGRGAGDDSDGGDCGDDVCMMYACSGGTQKAMYTEMVLSELIRYSNPILDSFVQRFSSLCLSNATGPGLVLLFF